jgi:hypothetical protein
LSLDAAISSDRLLTTLALLKVNQEEGFSYVDTYLPFVLHCLDVGGHKEVSGPTVQEELQSEFEIDLPLAVIKRLLREVVVLEKAQVKNKVIVVDRGAIRGSSLNARIAEVERGQALLVDALVSFANEQFPVEWSEEIGEKQIVNYINGFSSRVLAAAIGGDALPKPDAERDHDRYVVHRFARYVANRKPEQFDVLVSLVKGRMLADAMYFVPESREEPPSLKKVEVYLDAPPLLFLLGYAGDEMQAPYTEFLKLLQGQGAVVRCFEHSLTEAKEILDAAAAKANTGRPSEAYHGDVVSHLVASGKTRVDIELLSNSLGKSLNRLGVNPVEVPERKMHRLEPDEGGLSERLQRAINYTNRLARDRDVASLAAIYRIRQGREYRDLEKCQAIFATHNVKLFRTSANFFRQRNPRSVPPCVIDMALATMLWLRDPAAQAALPEDRILARAYAALNPNDQLWAKYNEEIDRLRSSDEISEDDAVFLRYDRDAQEALMDETRGDPEAFIDGTVEQVIARAREAVLEEAEQERDDAIDKAESAANAMSASRDRLKSFASVGATVLSATAFLCILVALILGAAFGPVGPLGDVTSGPVQAICAAIFLTLGILSIVSPSSLWDWRRIFGDWLGGRIFRSLSWIVRLDGQDDE